MSSKHRGVEETEVRGDGDLRDTNNVTMLCLYLFDSDLPLSHLLFTGCDWLMVML